MRRRELGTAVPPESERVTRDQLEREGWHIMFPYGEPLELDASFVRRRADKIAYTVHGLDRTDRKLDKSLGWEHPYHFGADELQHEQGRRRILKLINDEMTGNLWAYPLTSVKSAFEGRVGVPLQFNVWGFPGKEGFRALSLHMDLKESAPHAKEKLCERVLRICYRDIGSRPVDLDNHITADRFVREYLTVRLSVLHEIGHHLLHDGMDPNKLCERETQQVEQEADLFALVMSAYRGWPKVVPYEYDELMELAELADLEKPEDKVEICLRYKSASSGTPDSVRAERLLEYARADSLESNSSDVLLTDAKLGEIRDLARALSEEANRHALTWAGWSIENRKNDTHIVLEPKDYCCEETRSHVEVEYLGGRIAGLEDQKKLWREWKIAFPVIYGKPGSLRKQARMEIASRLGLVRLFEEPVREEHSLVEYEGRRYGEAEEQAARFYGLALAALHGKTVKHERLEMDHVRFLANQTKSGIADVAREYDENFFGWCVKNVECPNARRRYIGRIVSIAHDRVACEIRNDAGEYWDISLPITSLKGAGVSLNHGRHFKLFVTEDDILEGTTERVRENFVITPVGRNAEDS